MAETYKEGFEKSSEEDKYSKDAEIYLSSDDLELINSKENNYKESLEKLPEIFSQIIQEQFDVVMVGLDGILDFMNVLILFTDEKIVKKSELADLLGETTPEIPADIIEKIKVLSVMPLDFEPLQPGVSPYKPYINPKNFRQKGLMALANISYNYENRKLVCMPDYIASIVDRFPDQYVGTLLYYFMNLGQENREFIFHNTCFPTKILELFSSKDSCFIDWRMIIILIDQLIQLNYKEDPPLKSDELAAFLMEFLSYSLDLVKIANIDIQSMFLRLYCVLIEIDSAFLDMIAEKCVFQSLTQDAINFSNSLNRNLTRYLLRMHVLIANNSDLRHYLELDPEVEWSFIITMIKFFYRNRVFQEMRNAYYVALEFIMYKPEYLTEETERFLLDTLMELSYIRKSSVCVMFLTRLVELNEEKLEQLMMRQIINFFFDIMPDADNLTYLEAILTVKLAINVNNVCIKQCATFDIDDFFSESFHESLANFQDSYNDILEYIKTPPKIELKYCNIPDLNETLEQDMEFISSIHEEED